MKNIMKFSAFGAGAAALAVAFAAPAAADPQHCPPGHAKKGWCSVNNDHRDEARAYNEGYKDGQRDAIRYNGRYYSDYRVINDYDRYNLRPPRAAIIMLRSMATF